MALAEAPCVLTITLISDHLHIPLTDLKDMGNEHKKIAKSIKIQSQDRWEDRVTGAVNWHQEEHISASPFLYLADI